MKKLVTILILAVVASFTFSSCELSDDSAPNYNFELVAIDSVDIPETFVLGETRQITVHYKRPTSCHFYDGFYYEKDLNVRTVALQMAVLANSSCDTLENEVAEASFNFYVSSNGSYLFKFFNGKDEQGNNLFLEYEIPVVQE